MLQEKSSHACIGHMHAVVTCMHRSHACCRRRAHMHAVVTCMHRSHACIHTMHTYIHAYIHTYLHTYIHTYLHTYMRSHACVHTYMRTYIHTYTHTYLHIYIRLYSSSSPGCLEPPEALGLPSAPQPSQLAWGSHIQLARAPAQQTASLSAL
jgi:hypothetical protein